MLINCVIKELCNIHFTAFSKACKQTIIASISGGITSLPGSTSLLLNSMSKHPNATLVARCHTIHLVYLIYSLTSLLVTTYWAYSLYLSLLALFAIPHAGGQIPCYLSLLNHPIGFLARTFMPTPIRSIQPVIQIFNLLESEYLGTVA